MGPTWSSVPLWGTESNMVILKEFHNVIHFRYDRLINMAAIDIRGGFKVRVILPLFHKDKLENVEIPIILFVLLRNILLN